MQNNTDNKSDAFSDIFRHKLESHPLPVDADCWNEIEDRLKSKKRRIIPFWFWLSGGAAVAVLTLLFTLRTPSESPDFIGRSKPANTQQKQIQTKQIAKQQTLNPSSTQKVVAKYSRTKQTTNRQATSGNAKNKQENTTTKQDFAYIHTDTTGSNKLIGEPVMDNPNMNEELTQATTENKDTVNKKNPTRILPDRLIAETNAEPTPKPKNKQHWLLAASFGSGGSASGLSDGNNGLLFSVGSRDLTYAAANYTNILTLNDFSEKNYLAPISFGLTIRMNLDKTLSLESGLMYTYLLSTFENSGMQHSSAKLHLHYIGIPLNLVARLWENSKWDLYISGGTMVEKGIQSVYSQNLYSGNQAVITTTAKTNIDGLQWSVNGAIGITYKVQRHWGIFFEPKCSYYFDNNQPVSARTEHPVVMGMTAGVRFQFK
ncbi:MAG TPA: outer membrane beta-barrel protein [Paludibacter sp.]|nr:outer membrane beta-barrel protein [Paludibacter sp.]